MQLGAQVSTAGGLYKAFPRGVEAGCETIMIFTKSNRQWKAKPLQEKDIAAFKEGSNENPSLLPVAIHASYLINIGAAKEELWEKSYMALKEEVERAEALGIPLLTFHPGAYIDADEKTGLDNIVRGLQRLLEETTGFQTAVCLETTAGAGTHLGYKFEHLAYLLENVNVSGEDHRLGVCLDTCHIFAAGYDFRTAETYSETMSEFDRIVGLNQIRFFHFNDSKHELGSRKDRHEHIGRGTIGLSGFANFVNDPQWADHPAYLETPKKEEDDDGHEVEMDPVNLNTLRELRN
jgi:deoxyribonuclease-4